MDEIIIKADKTGREKSTIPGGHFFEEPMPGRASTHVCERNLNAVNMRVNQNIWPENATTLTIFELFILD
jgi:hypothetical protein